MNLPLFCDNVNSNVYSTWLISDEYLVVLPKTAINNVQVFKPEKIGQ